MWGDFPPKCRAQRVYGYDGIMKKKKKEEEEVINMLYKNNTKKKHSKREHEPISIKQMKLKKTFGANGTVIAMIS